MKVPPGVKFHMVIGTLTIGVGGVSHALHVKKDGGSGLQLTPGAGSMLAGLGSVAMGASLLRDASKLKGPIFLAGFSAAILGNAIALGGIVN